MGGNNVYWREWEDPYGGNLLRDDVPTLAKITKVNTKTWLVSGKCLDLTREFIDAFVLSPGGDNWGVTAMPKAGDQGLVLHNVQGRAFFIPFTSSYGDIVSNLDNATDVGFKKLIPGELHLHSLGHAELMMDAMGSVGLYDSVGDFIQLDTATATLRIRALQQSYQMYGFNDDGSAGVTIFAGNQSGAGGMPYNVQGDELIPTLPVYHLKSGLVWLEGTDAYVKFGNHNETTDSPEVNLKLGCLGNTVTMDKDGIIFKDANDNKVTMAADGVVLEDANGNKITMSATSIDINSAAQMVKIDGSIYGLHTHTGNLGFPTGPVIGANVE